MKRKISELLALAVPLAVLAFLPLRVSAQEFRGSMTGEVTDPSGAVIPNATVTAVQHNTQTTYMVKTNSAGVYYIPYVLPGTYLVTAAATGFKTSVQDNVVVSPSSPRGLNFRLQVGAQAQKVVVTSAPPLIDTTSASESTILTDRDLMNLPNASRVAYNFISLTPGSEVGLGNSNAGGWFSNNNGYIIGGDLQGYQRFNVNGMNITTIEGNNQYGDWMTSPNMDAVQEVNVMENTYDARYGNSSGGVFNIVTKSGTNAYHGDVFEYLSGGMFDANCFQCNYTGVPVENTHEDQYGATFGGPIKKNKLFFFGSFQGIWSGTPGTTIDTVPTAAMRNGDFTLPAQYQSAQSEVFNPATLTCASPGGTIGNCANNDYTSTEFPNDTIPAADINKTAEDFVNLFPEPNFNGNSPTSNYIASTPTLQKDYQWMGRADYNYSDKTRFYSTFEYEMANDLDNSSGLPAPAENGVINGISDTTVAELDMTHTFGPTLVGDFTAGFSRWINTSPDGVSHQPSPESYGLTMPDVPTATTLSELPEVFISGYPQLVGNQDEDNTAQTMDFSGDFTKIHGHHTIEWGGDFMVLNYAISDYNALAGNSTGSPNGYFYSGSEFTQYNPLNESSISTLNGNSLADWLLGYPGSGSESGVDWDGTIMEGYPMWGLYLQDKWRVTPKLTLTIGGRYDVEAGVRDRGNELDRGVCTTCVNPITSEPAYQANVNNPANIAAWEAVGIDPAKTLDTVRGGILFEGTDGQSTDAYNTDWGNWQPRLGFAYALNNKTVVRGGFGYMFAYGIEGGVNNGFSITTPYQYSLNGGLTPTNYFKDGVPFPNGAEKPTGSSLGLLTEVGDSEALDFPQRKIPRSQLMSLDVQRALPGHMTLDVGYSGNYARAVRTQGEGYNIGTLPLTFDYPELQQHTYIPAVASELSAQVPDPYYGIPDVPATTTLGSSPTVSSVDLMSSLSQFGAAGIYDYNPPAGFNWFDSLEVQLNKRLIGATRGLSVQLVYTYSKDMEMTNYPDGTWPWRALHPPYEPDGTDQTNVAAFSGEWDMPWGRGAKYLLTNPGPVLGEIVNGWHAAWIFSYASGTPVGTPFSGWWYTSSHSLVPTGGSDMEEYLYNGGSGGPLSIWESVPPYGQNDHATMFSWLTYPTIPSLNLTVEKDFSITESKRVQFQAQFFNITNSPLFANIDTNPNDGAVYKNSYGQWAGFGTVAMDQSNSPRTIMLSLKFFF